MVVAVQGNCCGANSLSKVRGVTGMGVRCAERMCGVVVFATVVWGTARAETTSVPNGPGFAGSERGGGEQEVRQGGVGRGNMERQGGVITVQATAANRHAFSYASVTGAGGGAHPPPVLCRCASALVSLEKGFRSVGTPTTAVSKQLPLQSHQLHLGNTWLQCESTPHQQAPPLPNLPQPSS